MGTRTRTTRTNRNEQRGVHELRASGSQRIRVSRVVQMRYSTREERAVRGSLSARTLRILRPFPSPLPPPLPPERCRFNPIGRPLGVCMAMHYSSSDERATTIVAYPKEGNATVLNVRFLRAISPSTISNRGHCPVGLTRGRSEIRYGSKIRCFNSAPPV